MERIYLDNAATTSLSKEALDAMWPYLTEKFGNPSSIYSYGRETKLAVEKARKSIARQLGVNPGEIFFTSGGTESTNTAITAAVRDLGVTRIITSAIEHHATLHTSAFVSGTGAVKVSQVTLKPDGHIDLLSLETLLKDGTEKTLVSLMHANNEIGNLLPVEQAGTICENYGALFHCDTVQTIGHYPIDLKKMKMHFAGAAAHKFHGPKGIGILYVREDLRIRPFLQGGAQERNMRAGTENVYGIVGMARALEIATARYEQDREYISGLKRYLAARISEAFPQARFNGDWNGESLYTVLNVSFPRTPRSEMLLINLDIHGICVSGGSACSSGADEQSHVIQALDPAGDSIPVRFSFSRENTTGELDRVVETLSTLL